MKIQLDTENKTIKLESDVELSKLVETLEDLLPDGKWKEFTLQTNTTITRWEYPVVIRAIPWFERPYARWTVSGSMNEKLDPEGPYTLKAGVFNIEA